MMLSEGYQSPPEIVAPAEQTNTILTVMIAILATLKL